MDHNSLSAKGPKPIGTQPKSITDYKSLAHPPHLGRLSSKLGKQATVECLSIQVDDGSDGFVPGFLHLPPDFISPAPETHHRTVVILLSGAGGGVAGPSSIYLSLACKLATLNTGIPVLRLDYRYPARNRYCVKDVEAAMTYLKDMYGLNRFILVGWSFGGAPVFTVGGADQRVIGCATVASQTAETEGIRRLAPRPVLLLHGTADQTLSYACSERLFSWYGKGGNRELKLFPDDNHALSRNAKEAEQVLGDFVTRCAGLQVDESEKKTVIDRVLLEDSERTEFMIKGGDLESPESIK
ncbi:hypothetical protein ACHAPJ_012166 [Fusarium lateritium]